MTYKITEEDKDQIKKIITDDSVKNGYNCYLVLKSIDKSYTHCVDFDKSELKNFDIMYNCESHILTKVYDYFIKNKLTDPIKLLEDRLTDSYYYKKSLMDFFISLAKKNQYKIASDSLKIMMRNSAGGKGFLNSFIKLSLLIHHESERVESFLSILKIRKVYTFTPTEKDIFQKIWDKDFCIDIKNKYKDSFHEIIEPENKDYINDEKTGFFYSVSVDCDKLSLINKVGKSENSSLLNLFFKDFGLFLTGEKNNYLGLKDVEVKPIISSHTNHWEIYFNFKNEKDYELHKDFVKKLIEICFSISKKEVLNTNSNKFFEKLLLNYKMNKELEDKAIVKKVKI